MKRRRFNFAQERAARRRQAACAATMCVRPVDRGMLMCPDHWWSLPERLRRDIVRLYRAGHWAAYRAAVGAARDLIDDREFKPLFPGEAA